LEGADGGLFPEIFAATTVKVYVVPFDSPDTVSGEFEPDDVRPPGDDVTVYPVMGLPPLLTGAVNITVAWALPAVAEALVGAPGTFGAGVTLFDGADGTLSPTAVVATTLKV
jgi:hypothetical protein